MTSIEKLLARSHTQAQHLERMQNFRQASTRMSHYVGLLAKDQIGRIQADRLEGRNPQRRAQVVSEYDVMSSNPSLYNITCSDPAVCADPVFSKIVAAYDAARKYIDTHCPPGRSPEPELAFAKGEVQVIQQKFITRTLPEGEYRALEQLSESDFSKSLREHAAAHYASIKWGM